MKPCDSCDVFQTFYVTDTSLFSLRILILVIALRQLRPKHVTIVRASATAPFMELAGKYQRVCHSLLQQRKVGLSQGLGCESRDKKSMESSRNCKNNTTALKVPGRSLSRVLIEPNPV